MEALEGVTRGGLGIASFIHVGERESGDNYVVRSFETGMLIGVMDALGHGSEAAQASVMATTTLEHYASDTPLELTRRCHHCLRATRGVVMGIASFDWPRRTMTWLGVGNVSGVLIRANKSTAERNISLLVRSGVVGHRLQELRAETFEIFPGDKLVLATDGVRANFADMPLMDLEPQRLADRILREYANQIDDAIVLVYQYHGNG